jgi:hypothetical protein
MSLKNKRPNLKRKGHQQLATSTITENAEAESNYEPLNG